MPCAVAIVIGACYLGGHHVCEAPLLNPKRIIPAAGNFEKTRLSSSCAGAPVLAWGRFALCQERLFCINVWSMVHGFPMDLDRSLNQLCIHSILDSAGLCAL